MSALKGTALITGASTGIGAVYADRLAKRGYDLILVARSQEKLSEVTARLKSTGRRIETISADLTKKEDLRRVAERGRQRRDGAGCIAWRNRNAFVGKGRPSGGASTQRDRDDR